MAHTFSPSTWKMEAGESLRVQGHTVRPYIEEKTKGTPDWHTEGEAIHLFIISINIFFKIKEARVGGSLSYSVKQHTEFNQLV